MHGLISYRGGVKLKRQSFYSHWNDISKFHAFVGDDVFWL